MDLYFKQLGSSVPSSLVDLDDQVLGLAPLAGITAQVTPNPRIVWFSISQQHGCLLQSFGGALSSCPSQPLFKGSKITADLQIY